jgi:predicted exporter
LRLERYLRWAWLAVLAAATAYLALKAPQAKLETSIFALVPWQARHPAAEDGAAALRGQLEKQALILVGDQDLDKAIAGAEACAASLRQEPGIGSAVCGIDEAKAGAAMAFFEPWRAGLYTEPDRQALRGDRAALLAQAEAGLYLPPGFSLSLGFERDPLGTYGRWLAAGAGGLGRFGLSRGHLTLDDGPRTWAAVLIQLAPKGGGYSSTEALARGFDRALAAATAGGSQVLRAGFVFHELEATRQAHGEVSSIGTVSLLLLGLLVALVLPQWGPRGLAFVPVLVGSLCGAAAVLALWGSVHLVALVFGSTVVGVAEDYGLFYLCGAYANGRWDPLKRRGQVLLPSLMAMLTSVLGYATLCFLPIPALKQVAVFAAAGLFMDWAGVLLWYPALLPRLQPADAVRRTRAEQLADRWPRFGRQRWLGWALGALGLLALPGLARLKADDDLRLLYAHDARLEAEQKEVTRLTGAGSATGFFVVQAADAQALLERQEALLARLDQASPQGRWQGLARVLPSQRRQREDRAAYEAALFGAGDVAGQLQRRLGAPGLKARLKKAQGPPLQPLGLDAWLAAPLSQPWRHLWRGSVDGQATGLLVAGAPLEGAALGSAADALKAEPGVLYVDQLAEVTQVLHGLRVSLTWALALGAGLVALVLALWLRRKAWAAGLPTLAGAVAALAALGYAGLPLNLFALLGLILLLGAGIDFGIYTQAGGRQGLPNFVAVNLAAVTNIAAVGVLAWSHTAALRAFGLVMAVGSLAAWLLAPCFSDDGKEA